MACIEHVFVNVAGATDGLKAQTPLRHRADRTVAAGFGVRAILAAHAPVAELVDAQG